MNVIREKGKEDIELLTNMAKSMTKQEFVDWYVDRYGDKVIKDQVKGNELLARQDDRQIVNEGPQPVEQAVDPSVAVGQIGPEGIQADRRDWQGGSTLFGGSVSDLQEARSWPGIGSNGPGIQGQQSLQGPSFLPNNQQVSNTLAQEWPGTIQGILPNNLGNRIFGPGESSNGNRYGKYVPRLIKDKNGNITLVNVFITNGANGNGNGIHKPNTVQPTIDSWGPDDSDIGTNKHWQQVPDDMNFKGLPNVPGMN